MDDDILLSKLDDETLDIDNMSDMGDIEIKSNKSKNSSKKKPKSILKPKKKFFQQERSRPAPVQQPPAPPKPKPNPFSDFNDKSFELFSNPQKRVVKDEPTVIDSDDEEDASQPEEEPEEEMSMMGDEPNFGADFENQGEESNEIKPSSGFATIDDEKQDLLYKFHRLDQKGVKVKKFNMYSDIREMRAEYGKIKKDADMTSGLKFSKRMLMAIVSGIEFLNKRYDPLNVELNGWSESVMENMTDGDYDNVLERLQEKYSGRVNTPPEMELLLSLAGSAVMFHMTSTMFKAVGPSINDFVKQNPAMMQDIFKKATQASAANGAGPTEDDDDDSEQDREEGKRRSMKGPSMDLSNLGGMFGPPPPVSTSGDRNFNPMFPVPPIEVDETPEPSISGQMSVQDDVREVSLASTTASKKRRGRKKVLDQDKGIDIDV